MTQTGSPDSSQRRWSAACPNCGATVEFASAASASAVCSFCRSCLLREGSALRKIGVSADLLNDYSALQLGASGRFSSEPFSIVGRLQIGYSGGSWNEWHALFDSGKSGWLSEDNGQFVLSFDAPLSEAVPQSHELVLGDLIVLAGQSWRVAALTLARVLAAQGELPRPPDLQGEHWVAELRNAQDEVGTLDYGQTSGAQWSLGRAVRLEELAMQGLREDKDTGLASRAIECPSCGAALTPQLANSKAIVCGQCHAVVDISQGVGADLAHYAQANGREPQIALGSVGRLAVSGGAALPWQVVGYQERCDLPVAGSDDEQTFWREYLLFNKTEGFAFLVDTEEGWSLVRPLTGAPQGSGDKVEWQGKSFKKRWSYRAKVTYVLGEFYWQVDREQQALVSDYEGAQGNSGALLSREQTADEVTWSFGRKLDASEVAKAFKLDGAPGEALTRDVASLSGSNPRFVRNFILGLFALFFLFMLVKSCSSQSDDCQAYKDNFGEASSEYAQCKRSGGPRIYPGGGSYSGGSYGGSGSGGGGHK
ncbi:DUF4178 domain-containing protein [Roseateles oligotrophus]|uniref:DUF4178 domain-containing protein n=1 Tax=Roseateles oligotrophus TaxID=1769250 RepID=A0ABT2Y9C2_9BURK|nr:DUF4178 domain-containing protein [Roseateles oligotrophus]MCV2366899.1 DUF4178 domain-containing protein [Roseateles oligotrophus]